MASKSSDVTFVTDGAFDFSGGVDSSRVTTIQSALNPNGLPRNALSWLNNATVRNGGITQRTGWQPLVRIAGPGFRWQGKFMYEPDGGNPYWVISLSGVIYSVLLEPPYTVTDLSLGNALLRNPPDVEMAFFCQGENFLVIQAGDYFTPGPVIPGKTDTLGRTLPLFWNGSQLRRSVGINNHAIATQTNGINEIPAATAMDYYGGRLWYAAARSYSAGDIVGGPSGTPGYHFRDSILNVTENPLCFGGDGFTVPTNAGNIRALKHSANLNASLGEGQFFIFTRKTIYSLTVPTTRTDWINANNNNQPLQTVVQLVNGAVGDRCVVPVNGDLFYQSFDPAIRSLITAVRYFSQWGNTPISQNENRALALNNRGLMRFSSGIAFDNRLFQLVLPELAADGINVIHRAILPLDFDVVSNMATTTAQMNTPVWEGAYDGLLFLQLSEGDFGGLPRAFAAVISELDGSLNAWELTTNERFENGDNRVTWSPEFPAFTWATSGSGSLEFKLKQLLSGELWLDKIFGTVDIDVYYRVDADPCWRRWTHTSVCVKRDCRELDDPCVVAYPPAPFREGYRYTLTFPEPPQTCDSMNIRPTTLGYQFQVKIMLKGWCRIRGLLLYAVPREKPQFEGVTCPPTGGPQGMRRLPMGPIASLAIPQTAPPAILSITPADLPGGSTGLAYSAQLTGNGGQGPYIFDLISGALPSGFTLNTSGLISGTTTASGTSTFSIRATDSRGSTIVQSFTIVVIQLCDWAPVLVQLTPVADLASTLPAWNGIFTEVIDWTPGSPMWYPLSQSLFGEKACIDDTAPCTPATWPACAPANWAATWLGLQIFWDAGSWFLTISTENNNLSWQGGLVSADTSNPAGIYTRSGGATPGLPTLKVTAVTGGYCVSLP